jgi:hypothetical protein
MAAIAFVKSVGTVQTKTSGSTLVIPVTNLPSAGNRLIICAALISNQVNSVTDPRGNAWAIDLNFGPYFLSAHIGTAYQAGDSITLNLSGATLARAGTMAEFSNVDQTLTAKRESGNNSGTSTTPTEFLTTPQVAGELVVGAIQTNGPSGDIYNADTDTDGGPIWASGANTFTRIGTTGGSANTNVTIAAQHKVLTSNFLIVFDPTLGTSRAWADGMSVYRPPSKPGHGGGSQKKFLDPGEVTMVGQAMNRSTLI